MSPRFDSVRFRSGRAGLTLVELFVVLLIMVLITGAIARLLYAAWDSQETITGQSLLQSEAQRAADDVVDRLRGATEITSGDNTSVTGRYANGDAVTYYLEDGALLRDRYSQASGATTTDTICPGVVGLDFDYFVRSGAAWAPAASAVLAESVRISISLASGKDRVSESSAAKLRNKV